VLEEWRNKRNGPLPYGPARKLCDFCIVDDPGNYVEGKTPKALALATAPVRLWTPSLP
jgi:hypothetical protein